jgi:hypothetical protein
MEPYWALAEDLDMPVGIHIGTGPPGANYLGAARYRARMHSALTIEEVLVKHPKLRVYIMHAGYPMLDDLLAVLYAHPQIYVDVGIIVYNQPRPAFCRYLQAIVDAGFANRVMFGSDQMVWPETIERAISVIDDTPFLTQQQKRDILYNNAARFLRLSPRRDRAASFVLNRSRPVKAPVNGQARTPGPGLAVAHRRAAVTARVYEVARCGRWGLWRRRRDHTRCWCQLWYSGHMVAARKITVEIPEELLERAQRASGTGVTQTVRAGLQLLAASQAYSQLRQLRGKVKFSRTLAEIKADR